MLAGSFRSRVLWLIAGLSLLCAALGLLLLSSGPRVRSVQFDTGFSERTLTRGSLITISFDRPIEQKDYSSSISFEPQVKFSTETIPQGVVLRLEQNLLHDQDYRLTLDGANVADTSGNSMSGNYQTELSAQAARLIYLQRNYGVEAFNGDTIQDQEDFIYETNFSDEDTPLVSHPQISMFAANAKYVVVVAVEKERDEVHVLDRETNELLEVEMILEGRVNSLSVSERGGTALLSVSPDFDSVSREFYDEFDNTLISLDLTSFEQQTLLAEDDSNIRAIWTQMNEDGQAALIQAPDQTFYVISPFGDYDPIVIGSHTASYGFDEDVSSILFRDNTSFSRYIIADAEESAYQVPVNGFVQSIAHRNDSVYVSNLTDAPFGLQEYEINRIVSDAEAELIWSTESRSNVRLRDTDVSYDGTLFALHLNPSECQFDQLLPNAECQEPTTIIYDTKSGEQVYQFNGFEATWIP